MTTQTCPSVSIGTDALTARISTLGPELIALRDPHGREFLWDGDPTFWKGRAPLLFPTVGRAVHDRIIVGGRAYPMKQHGFARNSVFEIGDAGKDHCVMTLRADAATLASYPFRFRLDVAYRLVANTLSIEATACNEDAAAMPVSFGFHPAFRWPLPGAHNREGHVVVFSDDETAPIRRLADGLLTDERIATPVSHRQLPLDDDLFRHDALVFDRLVSRRVAYRGPSIGCVELTFPDMPQLGIWTKPGAGFVCIEPWQGFASPANFDGEFSDRPGVVSIPPGSHRSFGMAITLAGF